jgi:hypothetical protein
VSGELEEKKKEKEKEESINTHTHTHKHTHTHRNDRAEIPILNAAMPSLDDDKGEEGGGV